MAMAVRNLVVIVVNLTAITFVLLYLWQRRRI